MYLHRQLSTMYGMGELTCIGKDLSASPSDVRMLLETFV